MFSDTKLCWYHPTQRFALLVLPSVTFFIPFNAHARPSNDAHPWGRWVTRPERPKGAKEEVKARRAPRLIVFSYFLIQKRHLRWM